MGYRPEIPSTPSSTGSVGIASPASAAQPIHKPTFVASVKLDPMQAGLQTGDFLEEVISHLQLLPDVEVNLSVEVLVKGPDRIDDAIARIVPDNARSHKVDNPPIY